MGAWALASPLPVLAEGVLMVVSYVFSVSFPCSMPKVLSCVLGEILPILYAHVLGVGPGVAFLLFLGGS